MKMEDGVRSETSKMYMYQPYMLLRKIHKSDSISPPTAFNNKQIPLHIIKTNFKKAFACKNVQQLNRPEAFYTVNEKHVHLYG